MNTAIIASAQGICFATAVDTVQWVALQLLQHGRVRRGHLGIMAQTVRVPQRLRRHMDLAGNTAVRVMSRARRDRHGEADWKVAICWYVLTISQLRTWMICTARSRQNGSGSASRSTSGGWATCFI